MQSLAVRYRPAKFEDVVSQKSIIKILERQIETGNISHCYLFCGASGSGKTTTARIFANTINKNEGSPIEIDAASNNGVDNVRELVSMASERSLDSKYKIVIMDECHVLTNQAWQAFLKCIEEPPEYTIFIFCTTDPQKIPATIINRCMRFNFNRISSELISSRLKYICEEECFTNYEDGCDYISRVCNGEMRQGISLLEKCARYDNEISVDNVLNAIGNYSFENYFKLINSIIDRKVGDVICIIEDIYNSGIDLKTFVEQFLEFCLDINKYLIFNDCNITKIPNSFIRDLNNAINFDDADKFYNNCVNALLELKNMLKSDSNPKSTVEVILLKMAKE